MRKALSTLVVGLLTSIAQAQTFLLVPDSGNDRIVKLDPVTGAILDPNFIVDSAFSTPIEAIDSGRGTVLVSDQLLDTIREYDMATGAFLRTLAGPTQGLDNIRGMGLRNGELYVTVASGANAGRVLRLDVVTGNVLGTFADLTAVTTSASPWDVHFFGSDVLITDSTGDDILRYDLSGNFLGTLVNGSNTGPINFPQQMLTLANGNLMASSFSPPTALYEFSPTGTLLSTFANTTGNRGLYELPSGLVLYSAGTDLWTLDRATNTHTRIFQQLAGSGLNNGSFRFINAATVAPEPSSLALLALGALSPVLGVWRRRRGA